MFLQHPEDRRRARDMHPQWGALPLCHVAPMWGCHSLGDLCLPSCAHQNPILQIFTQYLLNMAVEGKQQVQWSHRPTTDFGRIWRDQVLWEQSVRQPANGTPGWPTHPLLSQSWSSAVRQTWWKGLRGPAWARPRHLECRSQEGFPSLRRQGATWVSVAVVATKDDDQYSLATREAAHIRVYLCVLDNTRWFILSKWMVVVRHSHGHFSTPVTKPPQLYDISVIPPPSMATPGFI